MRSANPRWRAAAALGGLLLALAGGGADAQVLDLQTAWQQALRQDPAWRAAQAAAEAGREALPQARAALAPQLSLNGQVGTNELFQQQPSFFRPDSPTTHRNYDSSNVQLSLRQALFQPAALAGVEAAVAHVDEAEAALAQARLTLAGRLMDAYLAVLNADAQARQLAVQQAWHAKQLAQARAALAAGAGTRTDIDEAQARSDLNQALALDIRQQREQALLQLSQLVGEPVQAVRGLDEALLDQAPPLPEGFAAWQALAEAASPELAGARARLAAAEAEASRARWRHAPTVDVVAQWGRSSSDSINAVGSRSTAASVGLQISLPLSEGGRTSSAERQALAERDRLRLALDAQRQDLAQRLFREFQGTQLGRERVRVLAQAVRSAAVALDSARRSQRAGVRSAVDVLQAEQQLATAERDQAQARHQWLQAWVRLHTLAGRFDEAELAQVAGWLQPPR